MHQERLFKLKTGANHQNSIFFDTNLLILYVIGLADRNIVEQRKHKKIEHLGIEMFDLLKDFANDYDQILVTPHVLAEASNLICFHKDPEKSKIMLFFAEMLKEQIIVEIYEPSVTYIEKPIRANIFARLGLTDCAILELISNEVTLLTADLDLFLQATIREMNVVNMNHLLGY